jgi:catechol 2,3-dioxygenase-like lactoylglutathione lyase family enzyme
MNTFHLSLDVPDLDAAVAFYRELFGTDPAKEKPGYAKFELADPPVALALNAAGSAALSHLGIRVDSTNEVEAASTRLADRGLATFDERDTACCYARQDKVWVSDPAGNSWEVYTVLEDVEEPGGCAVEVGCC